MTDVRLASRLPRALLVVAAVTGLAMLAGCNTGLKLDSSTVNTPGMGLGSAPETCTASANRAKLAFDATATRVAIGRPGQVPENVVDIVGTVTGLSPSESIYLLLADGTVDCPIYSITPATVTGGTFTATIDLQDYTSLRVFAIATAAAQSEIACTASNCIQAGTEAPAGVGEALVINLGL